LKGEDCSNDLLSVKHFPIYFHGSISLAEIEEALHSRGMHLRDDGRGRFLADRVPRFLHSRGMHLRDDGRGRFLADRVPRFLARSASPAMRVVEGRKAPQRG